MLRINSPLFFADLFGDDKRPSDSSVRVVASVCDDGEGIALCTRFNETLNYFC